MKFCNIILFIQIGKQRPTKERRYHPWPLAASCVMKWDLRSGLCTKHQIIIEIQEIWKLGAKKPLQMTARPSYFSFAVISLKGNNLMWNLKLSLYMACFLAFIIWAGIEKWKEVGSEHPDHHPDSLFAWKGWQGSPCKQAGAEFPFRKHFSFIPSHLPTIFIPTSYNMAHIYITASVNVCVLIVLFEKCMLEL